MSLIYAANCELFHIHGKIAMAQNKPESAMLSFEKASKLCPDKLSILADFQMACKLACKWNKFFEIYKEAENKWPNSLAIKLNFGTSYMHLGLYQQALPYIEYSIQNWKRLNNENTDGLANAFSKLGICYAYLGQWEQSEIALQNAYEMVPWDLDMMFGHICIFTGNNRSENILHYLNTNIEKYPSLYPLYFWKADFIRNYYKDIGNSLVEYKSALGKVNILSYKRRYAPYSFVANTYCDLSVVLKEYADALSEIGQLDNSFSRGIWRWLGITTDNKFIDIYIKILIGDYEMATKDCKWLLAKRLNPITQAEILSLLALVQAKQGIYESALKNGLDAVLIDPTSYFALDTLGSIFMSIKNWSEAKKLYQKLSSTEPFTYIWQEKLGIAFKQIGDLENAKNVYEKLIQKDPNNTFIRDELNSIYQALESQIK